MMTSQNAAGAGWGGLEPPAHLRGEVELAAGDLAASAFSGGLGEQQSGRNGIDQGEFRRHVANTWSSFPFQDGMAAVYAGKACAIAWSTIGLIIRRSAWLPSMRRPRLSISRAAGPRAAPGAEPDPRRLGAPPTLRAVARCRCSAARSAGPRRPRRLARRTRTGSCAWPGWLRRGWRGRARGPCARGRRGAARRALMAVSRRPRARIGRGGCQRVAFHVHP
jgi:hypothetical protein